MHSCSMYGKIRINGRIEDVCIELVNEKIILHFREISETSDWYHGVEIRNDYGVDRSASRG